MLNKRTNHSFLGTIVLEKYVSSPHSPPYMSFTTFSFVFSAWVHRLVHESLRKSVHSVLRRRIFGVAILELASFKRGERQEARTRLLSVNLRNPGQTRIMSFNSQYTNTRTGNLSRSSRLLSLSEYWEALLSPRIHIFKTSNKTTDNI